MLDLVFGWMSKDIAIDLGTSNTRLWVRGEGLVLDLPTVVAVRTWRSGRREIVHLGHDARALLGRTPAGMDVIRPVRGGHIGDPVVARALLLHLFRLVHHRRAAVRPRVLSLVEPDAPRPTDMSLREALLHAGARSVSPVYKPVAALLGAGLDPHDPTGRLIIDVGGGTTQISLLSQGRVVASCTLDLGGEVLEGALVRALKRDHALQIGPATACDLKAMALDAQKVHIAGRCVRSGLPRAAQIPGSELRDALREPLLAIAIGVRRLLETAPGELASDVAAQGALIVGGCSRIRGVPELLGEATGLAMLCVESPDHVAISGAGQLLDQWPSMPWVRPESTLLPSALV